jgi:hypothetical protein
VVSNPIHVKHDGIAFKDEGGQRSLEVVVDASSPGTVILHMSVGEAQPGQFKANSSFPNPVTATAGQKLRWDSLPPTSPGCQHHAVLVTRADGESSLEEVTYLSLEAGKAAITKRGYIINGTWYKATPLHDPIPASGELSECVVCMEAKSDTAILWCGHICMCKACATTRNTSWSWMCAICRERVVGTVQLENAHLLA